MDSGEIFRGGSTRAMPLLADHRLRARYYNGA
jgi:hypothetical protein